MNSSSTATVFRALGLLCGSMMIIYSLAMAIDSFFDGTHTLKATITEAQHACLVTTQDTRVISYKVMYCKDAVALSKQRAVHVTDGEWVRLSFRDQSGRLQTQSTFLNDQWLQEKTQSDEIEIAYRPGSPTSIRPPPSLRSSFLIAMIGGMGILWMAACLYGARVVQRNYEKAITSSSPGPAAVGSQKKPPGKFVWIIVLVAVVDSVHKKWAGHFSVAGFAFGLLLVAILYSWVAWLLIRVAKKAKPIHGGVAVATQPQATKRLLVQAGAIVFLAVSTLMVFSSF